MCSDRLVIIACGAHFSCSRKMGTEKDTYFTFPNCILTLQPFDWLFLLLSCVFNDQVFSTR